MNKALYYITLFNMFICPVIAQQNDTQSSQRLVKMGDEVLFTRIPNFQAAKGFYELAFALNPTDPEINYKLALTYLNYSQKAKAGPYLNRAWEKSKEDKDILYLMGVAAQANYEFDKAIKSYEDYKKSLSSEELKEKVLPSLVSALFLGSRNVDGNRSETLKEIDKYINKRIAECRSGKELVANPAKAQIHNLGPQVNSLYPEYAPVIPADQSVMYFTSRRPNTTGGAVDPLDNQYFEDIYACYSVDNKWQKIEQLRSPINDENHNAALGLSADAQKMFLYNEENGGDIMESRLKGRSWTTPKKLPETINSQYTERTVCLSGDERLLFFERDGEGFGGRDLFMCKREKGKWSSAINLGPLVNTQYDEDGVFLHPDGKTLYFSSTGHNSMGGYDVFKTVMKSDGTWSKPVNLGYPINTPEDDIFYIVSADGENAYYTSVRPEGYGDKDIYHVKIIKEANPEAPFSAVTVLMGTIKDASNEKPIEATIQIIDNTKKEVIAELESNSETGNYLITLPSGRNYGIAVESDQYLFHSENFDLPNTKDYEKIVKNINLKKAEVGSKIVLRNIFFDFNKSDLKDESVVELDRLVDQMKKFSGIKIEVSGHTDDVGDEDYNKKLSEERAQKVVQYLADHGIDKKRLTSNGYGSKKPIAENKNADGSDNPTGRQLNRRTEFEITGK